MSDNSSKEQINNVTDNSKKSRNNRVLLFSLTTIAFVILSIVSFFVDSAVQPSIVGRITMTLLAIISALALLRSLGVLGFNNRN